MSNSPIRSWQSMTTSEAEHLGANDPVVILPVAAIEQHGPHLPLSTDLDIGMGLLKNAFQYIGSDFPAWVLPPQMIGSSAEHLSFPGTLSLNENLLGGVLSTLGRAVARCGVRRLLICNSHGGNRQVIDTAGLQLRRDSALLVVKSHYFLFPRPTGVDLPDPEWRHGLHGGAVETAMMLHLRPDLVRTAHVKNFPPLGNLLERTLRHVGTDDSGASVAWLIEDLNRAGAAGNATLANAAMGERLVNGYGRVLADVILDTKEFPIDQIKRSGTS
jgi:creatinine amidohydrolase